MDLPLTDPVLVFAVLLFIILAAPLAAERLRLPELVLLLLAGTILGPHAAGVLERDAAITLFGSVGLLYIMFLAGLEIDLHQFSVTRNNTILFGLLTFAIPQGVGTLLAHYILGMSWPASMLLASMFASHTLLAYPIASRLGIARTEPVAVSVGATIITDTLALLVLAVIARSAKGDELNFVFWATMFLGMAVLVSLIWWGIPPLSRWFFLHVSEKGGAQFLYVLTVMFGFAYLSHYANMEPIIGAFLVGVAFNRLIPEQSPLMNRVEFVGNTLFIPLFLISVGMLVDPRALVESPRAWLVGATMVAGVVVTKWLAAYIAAKCFHYTSDEGKVMFGLSVVQAAATLAAVLVGFELNIFDDSVLNGAIAMIFVTCPLGSWVVDRYGRRMVAQGARRPAPKKREQRLLVAVGNQTTAPQLLDLALLLRETSAPGAIHPVTVVPDRKDPSETVANGEKLLAACLANAAAADMPVNPSVRVGLNISDGIVRAANELRANMVLVGWTEERPGVGRIFGTILENLLKDCPSRILLCRLQGPVNTTQRILFPLPPLAHRRQDISAMVRDVKWLAKQIGAELHIYLSGPSSAQPLRAMIDGTRISVSTTIVELASWQEVRSRLFDDIQTYDMPVLPVERHLGMLWSPSLDRLPIAVASRFPNINVLAFYPPLSAEYTAPVFAQEETREGPHLIPVERALDAPTIEEAAAQLVRGVADWTPEQQAVMLPLLQDSARNYPVELAPGTVLLHSHSDAVDRIALVVGVGDMPWKLPLGQVEARAVVALVSPRDEAPEQHLKTLADLARKFHTPAVAERIRAAQSAQEVCAILAETSAP